MFCLHCSDLLCPIFGEVSNKDIRSVCDVVSFYFGVDNLLYVPCVEFYLVFLYSLLEAEWSKCFMFKKTSRFPPEEGSSTLHPNNELEQSQGLQSSASSSVSNKRDSGNKQVSLPSALTVRGSLSWSFIPHNRMLQGTLGTKDNSVGSHKERSSAEFYSSGTEESSYLDGLSSDSSQRESLDSFHEVHSVSHEEFPIGRRKSLPVPTQKLWRPRNDEKFICSFDLLACFVNHSGSSELTVPQVKKRRWFSNPSPIKESSTHASRESGANSPENNKGSDNSKQRQTDKKSSYEPSCHKVSTRPKSADGVLFARALSVPVSFRNSPYKSCLVLLTTQRLIGVNEVEINGSGGMQSQWQLELDQIEKVTIAGDNSCVNVYKRSLKNKEPFVILLCSKDGNMKNASNFSQSFEQSSIYSDVSNFSDTPSPENNKRIVTPEMLKETIEYECARARSTKREQRRGKRLDSLKLLAEQISRIQMESSKVGDTRSTTQDSSTSRLKFFKIFQKKRPDDDNKLSVDDVLMPRGRVETEKKPPMPVISLLEECSRYGYD